MRTPLEVGDAVFLRVTPLPPATS